MFEECNNCFLVKAFVNDVELLSVRDTGNFGGILVSSFKCGTANLQRQRRPYGVWILQRDQIVGTCYENGRKAFVHRIRQQIVIDDMQFGFMKGKGTTDAIFMARQMKENFRVKGKKFYFGFVDLEEAFDRVPIEVISWAMRTLRVEEWLVSAVMSMQKQSSEQSIVIAKILR